MSPMKFESRTKVKHACKSRPFDYRDLTANSSKENLPTHGNEGKVFHKRCQVQITTTCIRYAATEPVNPTFLKSSIHVDLIIILVFCF